MTGEGEDLYQGLVRELQEVKCLLDEYAVAVDLLADRVDLHGSLSLNVRMVLDELGLLRAELGVEKLGRALADECARSQSYAAQARKLQERVWELEKHLCPTEYVKDEDPE